MSSNKGLNALPHGEKVKITQMCAEIELIKYKIKAVLRAYGVKTNQISKFKIDI